LTFGGFGGFCGGNEVEVLGKKEFLKFINKFFCVANLAFPNYKNFPAFSAQLSEISFISFDIVLTFCFPELFVCFWYDAAVSAPVHVPETAVDKDYFSVFNKDYVWFSWQILSIKSVSIPHAMNHRANEYFWLCIPVPNLGHVERTLLFGKNIHVS